MIAIKRQLLLLLLLDDLTIQAPFTCKVPVELVCKELCHLDVLHFAIEKSRHLVSGGTANVIASVCCYFANICPSAIICDINK